MGDGVLGEFGQRLVDPLALLVELAFQLVDAEDAAAQQLPPADEDHAVAVDRHAVAVARAARRRVAVLDVDQRTPARASSSGPAFG